MDLLSVRVHEALVAKGVENIHHANTVLTACQFLRVKALLSRETVESRGLKQTPQHSDKLDKRNSIWFDVFTDLVDIHERASTENHRNASQDLSSDIRDGSKTDTGEPFPSQARVGEIKW